MGARDRILSLVDRIYAAAVSPPNWQAFVDELSECLGDAVVIMNLQLPDSTQPGAIYRAGIDGARVGIFAKYIETGRLPWLPLSFYRGHFRFADEQFPNEDLKDHDYYREWFEPYGLPPEGPIAALIAEHRGRAMAMLAIFRTYQGRSFTSDDVDALNLLFPHLARAYRIHAREREREAVENVMDRLSIGVILLDRLQRPVLTNRSADRILALNDGLRLDTRGLRASDPDTDAALRSLVGHVIRTGTVPHDPPHTVLSVPRPSGTRAFPLYVSPVLLPSKDGTLLDAAVTIVLIDPEIGGVPSEETLRRLFDLGKAESAVVQLLAQGHSLESAAEQRGVSLHTIRSQLKHVFAKTRTNRQTELLRLVLMTSRQIDDD